MHIPGVAPTYRSRTAAGPPAVQQPAHRINQGAPLLRVPPIPHALNYRNSFRLRSEPAGVVERGERLMSWGEVLLLLRGQTERGRQPKVPHDRKNLPFKWQPKIKPLRGGSEAPLPPKDPSSEGLEGQPRWSRKIQNWTLGPTHSAPRTFV